MPNSPDAVEEEEWEPAGDEAAHDEAEDERRAPLLLARHPLPLALALLRRRQRSRVAPALEAVRLRGRGALQCRDSLRFLEVLLKSYNLTCDN